MLKVSSSDESREMRSSSMSQQTSASTYDFTVNEMTVRSGEREA